jgi:hypothetical protein
MQIQYGIEIQVSAININDCTGFYFDFIFTRTDLSCPPHIDYFTMGCALFVRNPLP